MRKGRLILQIAIIVGLAVVCAAVANTLIAKNRQLDWTFNYPNAMTVPQRRVEAPVTAPAPVAPAVAAAPGPVPSERERREGEAKREAAGKKKA